MLHQEEDVVLRSHSWAHTIELEGIEFFRNYGGLADVKVEEYLDWTPEDSNQDLLEGEVVCDGVNFLPSSDYEHSSYMHGKGRNVWWWLRTYGLSCDGRWCGFRWCLEDGSTLGFSEGLEIVKIVVLAWWWMFAVVVVEGVESIVSFTCLMGRLPSGYNDGRFLDNDDEEDVADCRRLLRARCSALLLPKHLVSICLPECGLSTKVPT